MSRLAAVLVPCAFVIAACTSTFTAAVGPAAAPGGSVGAPQTSVTPSTTPALGDYLPGANETRTYLATGLSDVPGLGCGNPQYGFPQAVLADVSQTALAGQTFGSASNLTEIVSSTTHHGCSDGAELTTTRDFYDLSNPARLVLVGSIPANLNLWWGVQQTASIAYPSGRIVDELPELPGQEWTSSAAAALVSKYANGSTNGTVQKATSADGSYVTSTSDYFCEGFCETYATTTTENTDGSGVRTELALGSKSRQTVTLSAPVQNTVTVSTSGSIPPNTLGPTSPPCPTPSCVTPAPSYTAHAWYPYEPSPTRPLETIRTRDLGMSPLPAVCSHAAAQFAPTAMLIQTTDATLDVWNGTTNVTTDAYVDRHFGLVCMQVRTQGTSAYVPASAEPPAPITLTSHTLTLDLESENLH